jgi:NitT/TauT family transport system substrate-binding protein
MQAKKQKIVGIVLFGRHPSFALAVRNEKASAYRDARDLRGMKSASLRLDLRRNLWLNTWLSGRALAASEIPFVNVGGGAGAVAAVRHGAVDAVVTGETGAHGA